MKKRKLILIIATFLILVSAVIILMTFKKKEEVIAPFEAHIKIETVDKEDKSNSHSLVIKNSDTFGEVTFDFLDNPLYINNKLSVYYDKGYFNKTKNRARFRELNEFLTKLDLGEKVSESNGKAYYNPKLNIEVINELVNILNLGKKAVREESAFVVKENDKIKEFTLYLVGIDNYKGINILISLSEFKNDIHMPNVYNELVQEVSLDSLRSIK